MGQRVAIRLISQSSIAKEVVVHAVELRYSTDDHRWARNAFLWQLSEVNSGLCSTSTSQIKLSLENRPLITLAGIAGSVPGFRCDPGRLLPSIKGTLVP